MKLLKVYKLKNFNTINHKNLIIDMSSDLGSYKFNFNNLNYIYAGAQKNMGIPGVTICLVKEEFLTDSDNPKYLNLNKSNKIKFNFKHSSNYVYICT